MLKDKSRKNAIQTYAKMTTDNQHCAGFSFENLWKIAIQSYAKMSEEFPRIYY